MISNHYGWLYEGRWRWVVIFMLMLAGALIRHSFVARHKALVEGRRVPWEYAGAGVILVILVVAMLVPSPPPAPSSPPAPTGPVTFAEVKAVLERRCVLCHNAQVQNKGVMLHTPELVKANAQRVYQQAVVLRTMPLNNATQITDAERREDRRRRREGDGYRGSPSRLGPPRWSTLASRRRAVGRASGRRDDGRR
jgi:uncharacterized membrane protein